MKTIMLTPSGISQTVIDWVFRRAAAFFLVAFVAGCAYKGYEGPELLPAQIATVTCGKFRYWLQNTFDQRNLCIVEVDGVLATPPAPTATLLPGPHSFLVFVVINKTYDRTEFTKVLIRADLEKGRTYEIGSTFVTRSTNPTVFQVSVWLEDKESGKRVASEEQTVSYRR